MLARRRMVRRYDPGRPVPPETLDALVAAAVRAPSAGFTQAVSFLVLTGPDVADYWAATADLEAPDRWLEGLRSAPALIVVWTEKGAYLDRYAEPDKGWTDRDQARWSAPYWWVDAGMGVMAALLAAVDSGLGACFFGVPPDRFAAVRQRFGVPAAQAPVGVISVGYPAPETIAPPTRRRRAREEIVHVGRWAAEDFPAHRG